VIFGEEIAMFATQVATVGDVDGADGEFRQTEDENSGQIAKFSELSSHVHRWLRMYRISTGFTS
jgi:hypothetical protein